MAADKSRSIRDRARLLETIQSLGEELQELEDRRQALLGELASTVIQARDHRLPWDDIVNSVPLTRRQLMVLVEKEREARGQVDRPGIGVSEAARRIGVSTPTIYNMVRRGELRHETDHYGRLRIHLDDE